MTAIRRSGRRRLVAGLIGTAMLLVAGAARASQQDANQDLTTLSLEDLMRVRVEQVFGAAKHLQPATEAPASVSIITADDIRRYGYQTLSEILRGVRGLHVTDDRNYGYLGARGFGLPGDYNTRVLLLVDGHRINDDVFDQAPTGPELGLDPATFERVEIIRGPASALYGTSAFFAVVNVVTARGSDINGATIGVRGGTFGTRRVYGRAGTTFANGIDVAISGHTETVDGAHDLYYPEYDSPDQNGGHAIDVDGQRERGVAGRIGTAHFNLTGAYGWRQKVVPTAAFGTRFNDPRFTTVDARGFVDAVYERAWGATRYSVRGSADLYNYDGRYPYAGTEPDAPSVMQTDYGHGIWWATEARVSRPLPGSQTVTGGLEFRDYVRQNQGAAFEDERGVTFATDVSTRVFAAYVQDELRIRERWLVSLGGRYDGYSGFGQFSPRASVVMTPVPNRAFKFMVGTAFRAPNAYEFDYLTNGARNTALRAETLDTSEVAWEEYVAGWLRTSVSAYRNHARRLITLVSDDEGVLSFVNSGRVLSRGIEFEGEVRAGTVEALASYAWQRTADQDTGQSLVNSPHHLGKIRVSGRGPSAGSSVAVEVLTMSSRYRLDGGTVGAHALANFTYVQPVSRGLTLTASFRNAFDARYSDPASEEHLQAAIPQDGRRFYIGAQWHWTR